LKIRTQNEIQAERIRELEILMRMAITAIQADAALFSRHNLRENASACMAVANILQNKLTKPKLLKARNRKREI